MRRMWIVCVLLSGCTGQGGCNLTPEEIPLKRWTAEEQQTILEEERELPERSLLIAVLEDYARMRAVLRVSQ